jgi:hydrogenase/urease accessory protein HupE
VSRAAPALAAILGFVASSAAAHPLAPSFLEIREGGGGRAEVLFRTPAVRPAGAALAPELPPDCEPLGEGRASREGSAAVLHLEVDCGALAWSGAGVGVSGLAESGTDALVRVELADGRVASGVLRPGGGPFVVPVRAGSLAVARDYAALGITHIAGGIDHLLFVLGLLLLAGSRRELLATVTAFTLGHSLTLSAAVLGLVRVPPAPIEAAIAASILWLAVALVRRDGAPRRRPAPMAFGFGLLHGFGFAGALAQAGLPSADVPLALASFNAGIELGQLAFVVSVGLAARGLGAALRRRPRWLTPAVAYGIGSLAAYWLIARTAAMF